MRQGILYSAFGDRYLTEAKQSVASSLLVNPCPHHIFCDALPDDSIQGVTYEVVENPIGNIRTQKMRSLLASPFERTIYLDTDTLVVEPLMDIFDVLDRYDLAMTHAPAYRGMDDPEIPPAFYEFNGGVIAFRRSDAAVNLLTNWLETYEQWLDSPPPFVMSSQHQSHLPDQPSLRRCAWLSSARIYVLGPEFNYRTPFPGFACGKVRVVHGRSKDMLTTAKRLNWSFGPRMFPALEISS